MRVREQRGTRGRVKEDDRVLLIHIDEEEKLAFADLARLVIWFYQNEERIYPVSRGFKGGQKLLDFLGQACRSGLEVAARRHGIDLVETGIVWEVTEVREVTEVTE